MKIAHVITRLIIGGAQENTVLTCEGLTQRGHEVTLIAGPETGPEGSLWPRARRGGYETIEVKSLRRSVSPASDWQCAGQLTKLFRDRGFDVVHTHSSKAGILARYAAHRAQTPMIVHTIHGMSFNRTQSRLTQWVYKTLERRAAKWTDAFVCVADAMTRQAVAANIGPRERFTTIRSGLETNAYGRDASTRRSVRSRWGVSEETVVVGTIARLFRNKGYEQLLEALPAIAESAPNVRFVWVGDGAQRGEYVERLEKMGLSDRVHLTGLVSPEQIPALINGFDILAHASRWEGLPRVIVQAALTEVPAVSFDNDGAPEAIEHGVTGFLVPLGDIDQLSQSVITLANDPQTRMVMGQKARAKCIELFDAKVMVAQIDELYHRLAKR